MSPRSLLFTISLLVITIAATLAVLPFGCGLSTDSLPADDAGIPCSNDMQCDDGNVCTDNSCGKQGLCEFAPRDGMPVTPIPGNCNDESCKKGVVVETPNMSDVPVSDDPCISSKCNGGTPVEMPIMEGGLCMRGGGTG